MGEKAAAYMLAVSFKIPSYLETWVSHPDCLFWSYLLCWQRFAQFAQVWTISASAHLLCVGAVLWGLSEGWSWGLLCQGFILAHKSWQWHFTGGGGRGQLHPTLLQGIKKQIVWVQILCPDCLRDFEMELLQILKHLVMIPLTKSARWVMTRWLLGKNYLKEKKSVWSLQKQTPYFLQDDDRKLRN